ncbi:MAG TPA: hypothetical protein VFR32_11785 [Gaiellaceae bacterium]|nr:hypothetical protein [Gaiellaceae bacterium]
MRTALAAALAALAVTTAAAAGPGGAAANCAGTRTGYTPLVDLGKKTYKGHRGGLYANGRNRPTAAYLKRGLAAAAQVRPRAADGRPAASGSIVVLSIGMSNTTQEFSAFKQLADRDARRNSRLVIVDGAQGGQDAERVRDPAARFWEVVDARLAAAQVTPAQVQAVWLKEAFARPTDPFPAHAARLRDALRGIVGILAERYPSLRLVYLSSRTYAGYATTALNPEPYAFESGFAVRWLVEQRVTGKIAAPWLAWGPYLWTDGTRGRSDGLTWTCADSAPDGTHPSPSGRAKVAGLLLRFFTTDATAKHWFTDA